MTSTPWPLAPGASAVLTAPRPAPQTARLVQFSCQRLLVMEPEFAAAFHGALCGLTGSMVTLPPDTGVGLSAAVAHCVLWAALTQDPPDTVETTVREFGAAHHTRGFPDDAYSCLGHAVLRAVRATLPAGWSCQLSSGWVSYILWLQPYLESGARSAAVDTSAPAVAPAVAPTLSLEVIHAGLAGRYFPGQDRALNAVCTRVMLRTGADLRAPRPEQNTDPVLVAQVLESLLLMGYAPVPGLTAAAARSVALSAARGAPATDRGSAPAAATDPPPVGHHPWPWWRLRLPHLRGTEDQR